VRISPVQLQAASRGFGRRRHGMGDAGRMHDHGAGRPGRGRRRPRLPQGGPGDHEIGLDRRVGMGRVGGAGGHQRQPEADAGIGGEGAETQHLAEGDAPAQPGEAAGIGVGVGPAQPGRQPGDDSGELGYRSGPPESDRRVQMRAGGQGCGRRRFGGQRAGEVAGESGRGRGRETGQEAVGEGGGVGRGHCAATASSSRASAAAQKATMLPARSLRPVSSRRLRGTGPSTARQQWPAASP
jgi:hypothetical protein